MSQLPAAESSPVEDPPVPASRAVIAVVFTTILIDFAGFSVLIPVLPVYAADLGASAFEAGLTLTTYALAQLLFLPAWGWISDRFGRRPVLIVSLAGTAISYLILATASSLMGIYLARILSGFFAASIGTAQAVVTDVTPPSERAQGMGKIGAAIGVAFVVGPAFGGLFSLLSPQAPFLAVAAIAGINLALAWFLLPETRPPRPDPTSWRDLGRALIPAPMRLAYAVHDSRIGLYLYLFFHVTLGFSALESLLPIFLEDQFRATTLEIGLLFAALGVFLILTQAVLIGPLVRRFGEGMLVVLGLFLCAAALAAISIAPSFGFLYLIAPMVALGYGVAWPTFMSLFSQACDAEGAGELLGQSQSMATTGRVLGPMWAGLVMDSVSPGATFAVAGLIMFTGVGIFLAFRRMLVDTR